LQQKDYFCHYISIAYEKDICNKTNSPANFFSRHQPPIGVKYRRAAVEQDVLPCALTLTAHIQFPLMFLFGLFCRPFGGQKPSSLVDHGI
jgi:hypothetical protein